MTVSTTTNKAIHTGNGSLVEFAYTYRMDNDADMEVYLGEVLQPSGYTVARDPDNIGGTVTFSIAPAVDVIVTLLRAIDFTQETDYVAGDPFPAESHEDALDKQMMVSQQIQEQVDRNTQAIGGEEGVDTAAPPFVANKGWKWNDGVATKELINTTYDPDEQVTLAQGIPIDSATEARASAATAAAALASENKANLWAEEAEDVQVEAGEYSAHHWAIKAETIVTGVVTVNTRSGAVVLTATDVGLENCDNTSDLDKPVSTATQAAIDQQAIVFAIALG